MKLRYLYLAIGVLCNASLVSCGDSFKEKTEIVACGISTNALTFGVSSTEVQTVDITSEQLGKWQWIRQVVIGLLFSFGRNW